MLVRTAIYFLLILNLFQIFSCTNSKNKNIELASDSIEKEPTEPNNFKNADLTDTAKLDIQILVQMSIDLPDLQKYYHIDEDPLRSPLTIIKNSEITSKLKLQKFGSQVNIIDKEDLKKVNMSYLEFEKIIIETDIANLNFNYPIEGIKVEVKCTKINNDWTIQEAKIVEN